MSHLKISTTRGEKLLHKLHTWQIIEQSRDGYWFLIGNPSTISLYKIYEALEFGIKDTTSLNINSLFWEKTQLLF